MTCKADQEFWAKPGDKVHAIYENSGVAGYYIGDDTSLRNCPDRVHGPEVDALLDKWCLIRAHGYEMTVLRENLKPGWPEVCERGQARAAELVWE